MVEAELIDWLIANVDPTIKKAESKYSHFDAYSEMFDCFLEFKCRRKHYPDLLIERKKFEALTKRGMAFYICSTPEGIFSWELHKETPPVWEEKFLPRRTDFGNKSGKTKEVGYLLISEAKKLK